MKFTYFRFENFKGIETQTLNLKKTHNSNVFTLVGLNESGKTTILEAINYFAYNRESLSPLELDNYEITDIHNLIPINKRDNFNGDILIEAGIELEDSDVKVIEDIFKKNNITHTSIGKNLSFTQRYHFENSEHIKQKDKKTWSYDFTGKIGKSKKISNLTNTQALLVFEIIKSKMPNIIYFPNFLFEFPDKIYLDDQIEDPKHKFYQIIIQDVLDSLDNDLNISDHLIKRIVSIDDKDQRNLSSLLGKMQKKLTEIIFSKWNQIFNKEISKTEIVLIAKKDAKGNYVEFNIKDDVDTYRIGERSLGFRWFFVYILLTQFRTYRKSNKNVFFLFDEPASNLHPSAQTELLKSFEKLPNVIYTTHSHYLINPMWLESTFVIKNEAIDYENEGNYKSRNTNIKINRYREFAVNHPNQSSYFQPILDLLDYRPSNLDLVPNVVMTEGKSDFYTFGYFQEVVIRRKKGLKFIPGTSSSNMETLISLYLGWGSKFIVLLDSDKEGLTQKKRYIDLYGDLVSDIIFTYSDIDSNWVKFESEDLFSLEAKLAVQKINYPSSLKYDKKIFNHSIQELYAKKHPIKLDEFSMTNLNCVLSFLIDKLK